MHCEMLIDGHFIGGPCDQAVGKMVIRAPFDGAVVGTAAEGGWSEANTALDAAVDAFSSWRKSSPGERADLLNRIADKVDERKDELVDLLSREVGKPIQWSQGEVMRLGLTFRLAASLALDFEPTDVDLSYDPRGKDYSGSVRRDPIGVILGIVPYNWPFNLAAHKLAPALATGNTVVLKPSSQAPLSTLTLARIIHEAGCPHGVVNAVAVPSKIAEKMALDRRVAMVSFTGSPAVGWDLKSKIHDRRVTLELGGDAFVIVHEDADLDWAVERIVWGKFGYAGQICISVQHALVHESIYEVVREKLVAAIRAVPYGDPLAESTVCGPLISSDAADKVMAWIEEATAAGARVLAGGSREGNIVAPTLIENVPSTTHLGCQEVFGPVLTLSSYSTPEEAIARVNGSEFGIHAGIFSHGESFIDQAIDEIRIGGIVVNDVPTVRFDAMPYGGVKRSGFGREGVRYTMGEMTELKSVVRRVR